MLSTLRRSAPRSDMAEQGRTSKKQRKITEFFLAEPQNQDYQPPPPPLQQPIPEPVPGQHLVQSTDMPAISLHTVLAANASRARHRGQQRWCALMSRIHSSGIGRRLGPHLWIEFKIYARTHYYESFISILRPRENQLLKCVGPIEGGSCPLHTIIDFTKVHALRDLKFLHIDHTFDLVMTCSLWLELLPQQPEAWHDNVDAAILCHMLFSPLPLYNRKTSKFYPPGVQLRCHKPHGAQVKCHATGRAHYWHVPTAQDLALKPPIIDGTPLTAQI